MTSSRVTSKGQITLPKAIRERLGLAEVSVLEFIVGEAGQVVLRPGTRNEADPVYGCLREFAPKKPVSVKEMKVIVKARAAGETRGKTG